jgi:hypothetical protein
LPLPVMPTHTAWVVRSLLSYSSGWGSVSPRARSNRRPR